MQTIMIAGYLCCSKFKFYLEQLSNLSRQLFLLRSHHRAIKWVNIIKLGQYKITNLGDYSNAIKNFKTGDSVELFYLLRGEESKTQIELMAK